MMPLPPTDGLDRDQRLRVCALSFAIQFEGSPADIVGAAAFIESYIRNGIAPVRPRAKLFALPPAGGVAED